jgi:hypothetical protein
MAELKIIFKNSSLYRNNGITGRIKIVSPSKMPIKFAKEQIGSDGVFNHSLEGSWVFPEKKVSKMQPHVQVYTDSNSKGYLDYSGNMIAINGAASGTFLGLLPIFLADKAILATVHFKMFNMKGKLNWTSPYFVVQTQMVEGNALLAKISKVSMLPATEQTEI